METQFVKSLSIKGNRKADNMPGNMGADIDVTSADAKGVSIKSVKVKGDLTGNINVANSLGKVSVAGTAQDSTVRAGGSILALDLGASHSSTFLAGIYEVVQRFPVDHDDFADPEATIRSIKIKGLKDESGPYLSDTTFSAAKIGAVSLRDADFETGTTGLFAYNTDENDEIKSVKYLDTTTGEKWSWPVKADEVFAGPDDLIQIL
jgi:hypothetical protein